MNLKFLGFIIFILILSKFSFGQDSTTFKSTHSIYLELEGAVYDGYTLNYELILRGQNQHGVAFRVGGGITTFFENYKQLNSTVYAFPIEILFLTNHINHGSFEFGFGANIYSGNIIYDVDHGKRYSGNLQYVKSDFVPFSQIGFRYQSNKNHILIRLDVSLLSLSKYYNFSSDFRESEWCFTAGMSIGYCFK